MERGMWLDRDAFEELCVLVRDLAICQRRLVEWLDRREPGAGGVMSQVASFDVPVRAVRREREPCELAPVEVCERESRHSEQVARALGYIERHYSELIGLTRVAEHVGCSRSYLARAFRREVGRTMQAHVQQVRLKRAIACMREGDKVEAVMLDVGYRSKRNFYRLFKSRVGATPGSFRRVP